MRGIRITYRFVYGSEREHALDKSSELLIRPVDQHFGPADCQSYAGSFRIETTDAFARSAFFDCDMNCSQDGPKDPEIIPLCHEV